MWFICYKCNGEGYIDKKDPYGTGLRDLIIISFEKE